MSQTKMISHIDYALFAKTHPSMYLMHKYWARKPHNVVAEYIKHYSKPNEIVFDPFCGSGVTAIEALKLKRKIVAVDLDPVACFIAKMTAVPVDLKEFESIFEAIKKSVKDNIESLYKTRCPFDCGKNAVITHTIWEKSTPIEIWFKCPLCGRKGRKKPDEEDLQNLKKIDGMEIPYWYPRNELIWNTRVNVAKGTLVSDLFTKRNLIALTILYHEIEKLTNGIQKDLMKFVFTSGLAQAGKLIPVVHGGKECKSWTVRGYWVPPKRFEINVWNGFEERFRKICRGKAQSNESVGIHYEEAESFDDLSKNKTFLLLNQSSTDLSNIPQNSVDYVFTDPPYGDSVPYLELDYMWASWLGFDVNFEDEIIISDSPSRREKNFDVYCKMLSLAFREIYKTLKPGKWMTVTFHNTDITIYNSIIRAVTLAGFELEKIIYQPAARPSAKSLLHPYGSAVGDYYIRFRKPTKTTKLQLDLEIDKERYKRIIIESVKKIIAGRGEPTPYGVIVNSYSMIYDELKKNGYLFSAPETIEDILKQQLNKEFILHDNKWWFKDPNSIPFLERVPLHERVEKAVINVLNRKVKASYDDVLEEIFITFPNALTPETKGVKQILEEYAQKTKDKKWTLKPSVIQRQNQHDKLCEFLALVGERAGLNVYADLPQWRTKGITLPMIPKENMDRIKEIDVIWYEPNRVAYEFEVENTTGITEAIVRGANIPNGKVKRFIIIPEERKTLLARKLVEPALKERVEQDNWRFMYYDDMISYYEKVKSKKTISLADFEKLAKTPATIKPEKQPTIQDYM